MLAAGESHVVVIGGGWAGWGAAKSLCEAGVRVTLIDGMVDPTGSQPITTKSGKPFEAGTKRILERDYPNIKCPQRKISTIGPIFTDFTTSAFLVTRWIGSDCSCFWRAAPVAKPPWSSDGNSEQLQSNFRFKIDSASQDFFYAMLDLYRSDEVFPEIRQA